MVKEAKVTLPNDGRNISSQLVDYDKAERGPQIKASLIAGLGAFILGASMGWSSPVQPQLQRENPAAEKVWAIDASQMSWVASLFNAGALLGATGGGALMDRFGRKTALLSMAVIYLVGWLLVTFSVHLSMLYIGRIVAGIAGGFSTVAVPTYVVEVTTPLTRGSLGLLFSTMISLGYLFVGSLGWLPWRWISFSLSIASLFAIGLIFLIPESPYLLMKKHIADNHHLVASRDYRSQAQKSLQYLRGKLYNVEPELFKIKAELRLVGSKNLNMADLRLPGVYKPVLLGVTLMIFQQFSGHNVALFYSVEIFRMAGSSLDGRLCAVLINLFQVCAVVTSSAFLIKRFGRRTLYLISQGFACLSIFTLAGYFYVLEAVPELASTLGWLPLLSLITFIVSIYLGVAPLPWLISNEVLPATFKGPGSSIVALTNRTMLFIVTKTFFDIQRTMTTVGAFCFYGSVGILSFLFGIFILPETARKTPEEIQAIFVKRSNNK